MKSKQLLKILVFDSNGNAIKLINPGECKPGAVSAIRSSRFQSGSINNQYKPHADLNAILKYFETEKNQQITFDDVNDSSDIYIAFFWPKFAPRQVMENYKELQSIANNDTSTVKYKLLLFNQDYRDWGTN